MNIYCDVEKLRAKIARIFPESQQKTHVCPAKAKTEAR
jgi:hypothetical protein